MLLSLPSQDVMNFSPLLHFNKSVGDLLPESSSVYVLSWGCGGHHLHCLQPYFSVGCRIVYRVYTLPVLLKADEINMLPYMTSILKEVKCYAVFALNTSIGPVFKDLKATEIFLNWAK